MEQKVWLNLRPLALAIMIGFGILILLLLLKQIVWILVLIILASILAAGMAPIVRVIRSIVFPPNGWRIPRAIAVGFIYFTGAALIALIVLLLGGAFADQFTQLVVSLPDYAADLAGYLSDLAARSGIPPSLLPSAEEVVSQVQTLVPPAFGAIQFAVTSVLRLVFEVFFILTLALFLIVESDRILRFFVSLFPLDHQQDVQHLAMTVTTKIGRWLLGQLTVAAITGVIATIVAAILGLPYPLVIGLLTAIFDLAPVLGPSAMAFPVLFLGLTQSLLIGILGYVAFNAIAQLDGNLLSPVITGRSVQLSPTLIIIAVPIGLVLYGPIGALIAIPVTTALQVIVDQAILPWLKKKEGQPTDEPVAEPIKKDETEQAA